MAHSTKSRETSGRRLSGSAAVARAKEHLHELTGAVAESVSGVAPSDDGWSVTLEVVELERMPRTTDILGTYLLDLDDRGELLRYERVARYYRNQAGGGGGDAQ
jgi:hypothetical protein